CTRYYAVEAGTWYFDSW
nr:immunoglobulin heavy chain junction region [Macaca mulatta]